MRARAVVGLIVAVLLAAVATEAEKERVPICHVPAGNPLGGQSIVVPSSAAEAHLAHGDNLGACCPCWVGGDRPGGIDFGVQGLVSPICAVGPKGATIAGVCEGTSSKRSWGAQATGICVLVDEMNRIERKAENLSSQQRAACIDILQGSRRWTWHCES